jgi:hypothetical protein
MNNSELQQHIQNALNDSFMWLSFEHYGDPMVHEYTPHHEHKKGWYISTFCDFNAAYDSGSYPQASQGIIEHWIERCEKDYFEDYPDQKENEEFYSSDQWQEYEREYFSDLNIWYFVRLFEDQETGEYSLQVGYSLQIGYQEKDTLVFDAIIDPTMENLEQFISDKITDIQ